MTALPLTLAAVIVSLTIAGLLSLVVAQHRELRKARAHLAKFTGPRERYPVTKRFVSAKKVVA